MSDEWDRRCHVCWNRVYVLYVDAPRSDCPWGHTKAHECPDALAASRNTASFIKARKQIADETSG